jgi:hypothetical protein
MGSGHGLSSKNLMAWLAPTCTACRGWYFGIYNIMKGPVTPIFTFSHTNTVCSTIPT